MNLNERVYELVKTIPKGRVLTYGIIAEILNIKSPRLVGKILHNNPYEDIIPCHRVVNSKGRLAKTFAFGGENAQADKLIAEDINIKNGRIVNFDAYLWKY